MIRLQAALHEHGEAIEADFQRYYGVALADVFVGRLSWRRLKVLLRQLPVESATARAQVGPMAEWSPTEYLLAAIVDAERAALWQRGGGRGRRPAPVERPGRREGGTRLGRTTHTPAEVRAYLARFRPAPPAHRPGPPRVEVEVNGGR
jgi:hypothetical protein